MALRDQPYLPLFIKDFLTDEKLNECSAEATGVYIRLMCIMHKSEEYGTILLQQNNKQSSSSLINFADKLCKHMPYKSSIILKSLNELIEWKVLYVDGDKLCQKRMIEDNELSIKRSKAGSKGGFATAKVIAKDTANTATANAYVIETEIRDLIKCVIDDLNERGGFTYRYNSDKTVKVIKARLNDHYKKEDFISVNEKKCLDWLETDNAKYLRPETLYGAKFESYLNQPKKKPPCPKCGNTGQFISSTGYTIKCDCKKG